MSGRRLTKGGAVERGKPIKFSFEGASYTGFAGDTLASALLANGVDIVGRSFKYHRPRGLMAAGVDEPNALIQLGEGAYTTPNLRATEIELYDGLVARAVNCWPSVRFDMGAINNAISRFIPAGFYYKTFMWPNWHWFEPLIRRAAGLGKAATASDPDRYENRHAHCDVLVVGSGPGGLAAALAAARSGARIMLVEQDHVCGGSLRWETATIDGIDASAWADRALEELSRNPEVVVLNRTTAAGYYDHNFLALVERVTDHLGPDAPTHLPRQRLWQVRARRVILATGALERPLVFPGNDRPGVMLASAVRRYLRQYGALAGGTMVLFTNNDEAYRTVDALMSAGARLAAVVDSRAALSSQAQTISGRGVPVFAGGQVIATHGSPSLSAVTVRSANGSVSRIDADVLAISGGWNPSVHLFCQSGGKPAWDAAYAFFKPGASVQAEQSVGAAAGVFSLDAILRDGHASGCKVAQAAGLAATSTTAPCAEASSSDGKAEPLWKVDAPGKAFVDFQNDVTADDVALAARESFVSVEHLKRYTTLGMGTDQGKTSNVNALALMSNLTGKGISETGTTRYRFPFTPVTVGVFAGSARGDLFRPIRSMPCHAWHEIHGAVFEEYGGWRRPAYYLKPDETAHMAEQREALAVRNEAGLFEGSPLGKIEVKGPDAAEFLDRIYANTMSTLKVGKVRYGLMLNELGVIIDDGVAARLADDHFFVGTTSAGAARIAAWMEEWLQCEWTGLNVLVAPVTTSWAVLALAGPKARDVLQAVGVDFPLEAGDFPHMNFRDGHVAGIPARVFRVSFTGELTYEINVPQSRGLELWEKLMTAGVPVTPIGIDAWMLLRTEKGYPHVGADTDGTSVPDDIGWGHILKRSRDFVGRRSLTLPDNVRPDRLQFVGLEPIETDKAFPVGAQVRAATVPQGTEGYVTSAGFSPVFKRGVALAMVQGGRARYGEVVDVIMDAGRAKARITPPGGYDPKGERLNG